MLRLRTHKAEIECKLRHTVGWELGFTSSALGGRGTFSEDVLCQNCWLSDSRVRALMRAEVGDDGVMRPTCF